VKVVVHGCTERTACYVFLCIPYWQFDNCMECKEVCCGGAPLSSEAAAVAAASRRRMLRQSTDETDVIE